jgi:ribosome recycling factor
MIDDILSETRHKMQASLRHFEDDLQGLRSGRASIAMVDRLMVDYYGQETELRQVANNSTPEALQILILPYDKASVKGIEKAIQEANIGVNPNVDGEVIRLNMPPLTRERRQELVKVLNKRMEESRVAIRNIRRSANNDLQEFEKEKLISEDDEKQGQEEVQKLTDEYIARIDELGKAKEEEILAV